MADVDGGFRDMRFVGLAVAAAALYALSVPLSKLLMGSVDPGALAGRGCAGKWPRTPPRGTQNPYSAP